MTFKDATDRLTAAVSLTELADAAGISPNAVRQARMKDEAAKGHRPPPDPEKWRPAVARLARERARSLLALAEEMERGR